MAWGASASKRAPREWVYDSNYHKIYNLFTSIVFFFLVSQYSTRVDGYGSGYIRVRVAPGTIIGTRTHTRLYPVQKPGRVSIPVAITNAGTYHGPENAGYRIIVLFTGLYNTILSC